MADAHPEITPDLADWISRQRIFFAASAAPTGRVNVSPRPTNCLRVLSPLSVAWLDMTGSGHETAAHLRQSPRLTIMFCAFDGPPRILRLYGEGESLIAGTPAYAEALAAHFDGEAPRGARQIVRLEVDYVQTSCGYGVPLFDYKADRPNLHRWAENKSDAELLDFRDRNNARSLDGFEAPIPNSV